MVALGLRVRASIWMFWDLGFGSGFGFKFTEFKFPSFKYLESKSNEFKYFQPASREDSVSRFGCCSRTEFKSRTTVRVLQGVCCTRTVQGYRTRTVRDNGYYGTAAQYGYFSADIIGIFIYIYIWYIGHLDEIPN